MSLVQNLLASDPQSYNRATQSRFLSAAANGAVPRDVLARWLANDRLYIHSYIKGVGRLLDALDLPDVAATAVEPPVAERLFQWLIDALVNVRREEKFFIETAARFGIEVNLPASRAGVVEQDKKLDGLKRFERLFGRLSKGPQPLGWLEGAVLLYATEKCYLDSWSGARDGLDPSADGSRDADGGALRREFIPNWSSDKFRAFVDELGAIIDQGYGEVVEKGEEGVDNHMKERALVVWREVMLAEETFWPALD
ncbi:heme oxygenase-like protein [Colletotrichum caudatum]|nr:heme oxygenase-like protein [Colletotrichum caudatum]